MGYNWIVKYLTKVRVLLSNLRQNHWRNRMLKRRKRKQDKALAAQKHVDVIAKERSDCTRGNEKVESEQVDYIVAKASVVLLDAHGELALHAYEETWAAEFFEDGQLKKPFRLYIVVTHAPYEDRWRYWRRWCNWFDPDCGASGCCLRYTDQQPTSTAIFKSLTDFLKTRNPIILLSTHLHKNHLPMQRKSCVMSRLQQVRLKTVCAMDYTNYL